MSESTRAARRAANFQPSRPVCRVALMLLLGAALVQTLPAAENPAEPEASHNSTYTLLHDDNGGQPGGKLRVQTIPSVPFTLLNGRQPVSNQAGVFEFHNRQPLQLELQAKGYQTVRTNLTIPDAGETLWTVTLLPQTPTALENPSPAATEKPASANAINPSSDNNPAPTREAKIREVFQKHNGEKIATRRIRLKYTVPKEKKVEIRAFQARDQFYTITADDSRFSVNRSDWKGAGNIEYGVQHEYRDIKSIYFSEAPGSMWFVLNDGKYFNIIASGNEAVKVQVLYDELKAAGVEFVAANPYGHRN